MLEADDLYGVESDLALRIIAAALSIAPRLDTLPEGRNREMAIAILKGIAGEAGPRGSRHVKGQRIGPAGVDYADVKSWFFDDDRNSLRALCGMTSAAPTPIGYFPKPGIVSRIWPEGHEHY